MASRPEGGHVSPRVGHSDRLNWVARSIPDVVWITEVKMDGARFEVAGFTLEPSALNEWVDKLGASPLMQGLKLATVKVENAALQSAALSPGPAGIASGPAPAPRPAWSFNLVSVEPFAPPAAESAGKPGSQP